MQYRNNAGWRYLRLVLVLSFLGFSIRGVTEASRSADIKPEKGGKKAFVAQSLEPNFPAPSSQSKANQSKEPVPDKKSTAENQKPGEDSKPPRGLKNKETASSENKKQLALSLLEEVLASSHRIAPVEFRIMTEVEAATLVWEFDKERSISMFKSVIEAMRQLLEERGETTVINDYRRSKERRLWFLALRKITALQPELVQELLLGDSRGDEHKGAFKIEWTEEARAVMSIANQRIGEDPKFAARLAEQSLALGAADWTSFLIRLGKRDSGEAERLAIRLMDILRDSSSNPGNLRNMVRFVFTPGRSATLKEYFFQSLAIRLRRDIRPDATFLELEDGLSIAREMRRLAAADFPHWQQEFDNISFVIEELFRERSLSLPGSPRKITVDLSRTSPARPGDTQEITDAAAQVEAVRDPKAIDKEYRNLAVQAAIKADVGLAEKLLSKISDEKLRRETTVSVYSPLVRQALGESDWSQAQKQALKIADPLGRTLAFETIARAMSGSNVKKALVIEIYNTAMAELERDDRTDRVAKAFLLLARSLYPLDMERGLEAVRSCIYVLNRLDEGEEPLQESEIGSALEIWVRRPEPTLKPDEILDLTNLVTNAFEDLARRDVEVALWIAWELRDRGMYSLAQLAISKVLLEEAKKPSDGARRK